MARVPHLRLPLLASEGGSNKAARSAFQAPTSSPIQTEFGGIVSYQAIYRHLSVAARVKYCELRFAPMKVLKILGFTITGIVVLLAGLWWGCSPHQPSDAELQKRFESRQAHLKRLVEMMDQDWGMCRIAPDFTWRQDNVAWPRAESEWGISRQRWDEYRTIFLRAGFKDGTTRPENSSDIIVSAWSWGIVSSGISVGYLHCGTPLNGYAHTEPPCIENHESGKGMYGDSTSYGYRYKRIAPDWYIYEQAN